MPKLKLPPQGGEKWLCIFTFLFMMFSVLMTVSIIYCIVIIYAPSIKELQTAFQGPKRCTTTLVERNITSLPGDGRCGWASCEEWCLSQGSSPCSKMYGILRDAGASISWEKCEVESLDQGFEDHLCTTLEDLKPINCKRSKYELTDPGNRELCMTFNELLISCEGGYCKNVSKIYRCTYNDYYQDLLDWRGKDGKLDGWCNCNQCENSNTTIVDGDTLTCPKETEYCFLPDRNPATYDEKMRELCASPSCEACMDICKNRKQCLNMKSRRDVVHFGVDEYEEPLLTYYDCKNGYCTEIHNLMCNRTCDYKVFNISAVNVIILQGERVVMANCRQASIGGTDPLPSKSFNNPSWDRLIASCSKVTVNKAMNLIQGEDCLNGTWVENLGYVDYNTLTRKYEEWRSDPERWVRRNRDEENNLLPWEEDVVILNYTRILKNQKGCVNTLSMECMDFFTRFGRDGANYTSRAVFDCYYDPEDETYVVIDYQPNRTLFFLIFWSVIPGCIMVVSCLYMCICSKFVFIGDDGHMRIFCCGKAVTGIGEVAVYKPPSKGKGWKG